MIFLVQNKRCVSGLMVLENIKYLLLPRKVKEGVTEVHLEQVCIQTVEFLGGPGLHVRVSSAATLCHIL